MFRKPKNRKNSQPLNTNTNKNTQINQKYASFGGDVVETVTLRVCVCVCACSPSSSLQVLGGLTSSPFHCRKCGIFPVGGLRTAMREGQNKEREKRRKRKERRKERRRRRRWTTLVTQALSSSSAERPMASGLDRGSRSANRLNQADMSLVVPSEAPAKQKSATPLLHSHYESNLQQKPVA